MGDKKDTYSYDAMDQLTAYTGYDGYQQRYTYNAQGMMSAKESKGNAKRLTLEEIVEGKEKPSGDDDDPDPADEWVKTSYIYDITMPYYEVLTEETDGVTTAYDYGIERISAITSDFWYNAKTAYVYDGRGSVAQEVSYDISWYTINTLFAPSYVTSKSYTPFGEQLNDKASGYGYNGEYYDAATGMVNLRARQYEPAMMRFMQKDTYTGNMYEPRTQHLYAYCGNDPVNFVDPTGHYGESYWKRKIEEAQNQIAQLQKYKKTMLKSLSYLPSSDAAKARKELSKAGSKISRLQRNIEGYYKTLGTVSKPASKEEKAVQQAVDSLALLYEERGLTSAARHLDGDINEIEWDHYEVDGSDLYNLIEYLNRSGVKRHGGDPNDDLSIIEKLVELLIGELITMAGVDVAIEIAKVLFTIIDPDYNPGVILKPGDVCIYIGENENKKIYIYHMGRSRGHMGQNIISEHVNYCII